MTPGYHLFWGSKSKGHKAEENTADVGLCTLASAGFFQMIFISLIRFNKKMLRAIRE